MSDILIVDDERDIRELISDILIDEGYATRLAGNSDDAMAAINAEAPALIPELPNSPDPKDPHRTVLSMARWRRGERVVEHLATVHPHGFWMQWRSP